MRRGQIILEILVAVGVATVAILALVQVATRSVANSGFAKRQSVATAYAAEGMEWVKGRRELEPWAEMQARSGQYCLNSFPGGLGGLVVGNCGGAVILGTEYTRTVTFTQSVVSGTEQDAVVVVVQWTEGGRVVNARQETFFLQY